jgi:hypothetical protein
VSQQVWHDKDHFLRKGRESRTYAELPVMVVNDSGVGRKIVSNQSTVNIVCLLFKEQSSFSLECNLDQLLMPIAIFTE